MDEWFKIKVLFPVETAPEGFRKDEEDEDEDPVLKRIRLSQAGVEDVETEYAYFNLVSDPIMHLVPGSYLGREAKNKRSYTLIVFESGNTVTAVGKPEDIFNQLSEFIKSLPRK